MRPIDRITQAILITVGVLCVSAFASSCSSGSDVDTCVPGATQGCVCLDGNSGAQACEPDGTYGACVCDGPNDTGTDASDAEPDAPIADVTDDGPVPDVEPDTPVDSDDPQSEPDAADPDADRDGSEDSDADGEGDVDGADGNDVGDSTCLHHADCPHDRFCSDGACVPDSEFECTETGMTYCDDGTRWIQCSPDGRVRTYTSCSSADSTLSGRCDDTDGCSSTDCTEGDRTCTGLQTVSVCDAAGMLVPERDCAFGDVCRLGDCVSDLDGGPCEADSECPSGFLCSDGACTESLGLPCDFEGSACADIQSIVVCEEGLIEWITTCSFNTVVSSTCSSARCSGSCLSPGEFCVDPHTLGTCDEFGNVSTGPCPDGTRCDMGICR